MPEKKRYVYGTRTKRWSKVGKSDRDYQFGLTPAKFKSLGRTKAKEKYLGVRLR